MNFRAGAIALVVAGLAAAPVLAHDTRHGHRRNPDVRVAQEKLSALGYETGRPDGMLGSKTHSAIKKFQEDKGLQQTGRLDDHTRAALQAGESPTAGTH